MITGNEPAFSRSGVYCPPPVKGDEFVPSIDGLTIFQELSRTYIAMYVQQGFVPDSAVNRGIDLARRTIAGWNSEPENWSL